MAEIFPFAGVRYNQQLIHDLAQVICPPYDIISPQQQDALYQSSEHNFVRIEYNRESTQDSENDNRYTRAAANIKNWLAQGILKAEGAPAIYLHQHYFTCQGKQYERRNIIGRVKLEEWSTKIIRPHENIIPRAKSDRMSMLYACEADTSEILSMYADTKGSVASVLKAQEKSPPVIDFVDNLGERHKVWAITQLPAIQKIQEVIESQPLYIADGHHRYDSALTYCREMVFKARTSGGLEGFNFVMMALMDIADPGLVILPTHRLLRGIAQSSVAVLKSKLQGIFDIESLDIDNPDIWQKTDSLLTGMKPNMQKVRLAIFGLETGKLSILTLRDYETAGRFMPGTHGEVYKKLDVSLVDHMILDNLLGFVKDKEENALIYTHDRQEAINRVKNHEYQLAFILNPVRPETIKAIADASDRMPRKSTYFYPKSPAGMVFYKW